ncbi:MAG: hypothetical protein NZ550_03120 [Fimbriimonadales bacterium]|nr:hypothetical protein [Fimbriimonadales bacterium]MDW8051227.1 hypothetical protein [Armatimonadota bacterium]
MGNLRRQCVQGRVSCWLLGGLGCLGLIIIGIITVYLLVRAGMGMVQPVIEAAERGQKVLAAQRTAYAALRQYAAANNGKYPKTLKELTPRYTQTDLTKPIVLDDGTKVTLVYKSPQPNAAPDTVILEHKPPIKATTSFLGTKVVVEQTFQIQLNGEEYLQQVIIDPQGNKRVQRTRLDD